MCASGNDISHYRMRFLGIELYLIKERYNVFFTRISLLSEIIFVTVASILLIKFLQSGINNKALLTLAVPVVLISGAIIPTLLRKKELNEIGIQIGNPRVFVVTFVGTCLVAISALICGILILNYYGIPLPMRPIIPKREWPMWIIYQFMYVAVPEEVFFRGYLQSNVMYLLAPVSEKKLEVSKWGSIIIPAIVFAAAHAILLGKIISFVTFFPGLIMGWMFFRTKSVLAPILFHGLANIGYGVIAGILS